MGICFSAFWRAFSRVVLFVQLCSLILAQAASAQTAQDVSLKLSQAAKCGDLLTKTDLRREAYALFSRQVYWKKWIDDATDFRRLINKSDLDANQDKMHPTEIYGVDVYLAWREADRFLNQVPIGQLDITPELISEVHRLANQASHKWVKKIFGSVRMLAGVLPSKDGVFKKRFSVGREALFRPLSESEFQAIKNNPWLDGFWELPRPFSRVGKRRGFIVYASASKVRAKLGELINWYDANKGKMNPIELAARFQQAYVSIHPHVDGNGRTSRLLMDRILAEHGLPAPMLEAHTNDLYLTPEEYTQQVSEGIDAYFKEMQANDFFFDTSLHLMVPKVSSMAVNTVKRNASPMTNQPGEQEVFIAGHAFSMQTDGFFYSNKGIPYVFNDGKMYPIADRTYLLYFDGGKFQRNAGKSFMREMTESQHDVYKRHFNLYRAILRGETDPSKIEIVPYERIAHENEHEGYVFYDWQRPLLKAALTISETDPLEVMMRARREATSFEVKVRKIVRGSAAEWDQMEPAQVLAQYEMLDFKYYELEKLAFERAQDLIPYARDCRVKVHRAARQLLKPFLDQRASLNAAGEKAVLGHAGMQVWDNYFARSKLSFESFDDAMKSLGDDSIYLIRNDSMFSSRFGFHSQDDYKRYFDKIPASERIRAYFIELDKFFRNPKNTSDLDARIKNAQKHLNDHDWVYKLLPKSLAEKLRDLKKSFPVYRSLLSELVGSFFESRYVHQGTSVEYERAFVDYDMHASGSLGTKQGVSFTSSLDLLLPMKASEDPADWDLIFTSEGAKANLYLVKIPKKKITWNFATDFKNEYEFILNKPIGPWKIVHKFTQEDLFKMPDRQMPKEAYEVIKAFKLGDWRFTRDE